MKHSAKFLFKGLLVIAFFTTGSIALSTAGVNTVSEAKAAVSQQQVNLYLTLFINLIIYFRILSILFINFNFIHI